MIKFTVDLSDPAVRELVTKEMTQEKSWKNRMWLLYGCIGLSVLCVLYLWIRSASFSIWYPVYLVWAVLGSLGLKSLMVDGLRKGLSDLSEKEEGKPEYTVTEEGIAVHTEHRDGMMSWSYFSRYDVQGRILYLQTAGDTFLVCHARQLSLEDFAAFKALAADRIGNRK